MDNIFNWAIDKYLSKYLEINKDETKASLFKGEIEMSNVKIKPEIFTTMNLPYFQLVNGYIGRIKLKVQFPRFYLYPIKMVVEKVFFHAKQKKLDTIDKKVEIENMETYKNDQLLSMEELSNEVKNLKKEGGPGYLDRIINNLEIEIKDICVRFDDDLSYNLIPFTFGLLLKNLKIKTVDENFKEPEEGKTIPIGDINRKILKMENFSLYLDTYENEKKLVEFKKKIVEKEVTEVKDEKLKKFLGPMLEYYRYCLSETEIHINERNSHQYLNYNSGFLIKFAMNQNLKNGEPQYLADCKFDQILMSMSLVQIKAAMKLLAYQDLNSKYQIGLAKEYYVKVLNENDKISYIENYIEYYKAKYGAKKNEKEAKKYGEKIKQVEKGLKYEDIWIMREAAEYKLFHNSEIDKIDEQIKKLEGGTGFFSFFSSGPNEEQKKEIKKLNEQKKKLMKEDINKSVKEKLKLSTSSSGEIDKLKDIPDDFVLYKVSLELPMFSLDINQSKKEKMLSMEFNKFSVNGKMKKKGQLFNLSIDDISAKQYQLKNNNMYETILATIEQKDDKPKNKDEIKNGGTCDIEFENNPNLEKSNFRFKFRNTKRLIITVNLYSIQYIMNKVLDSLATTISKFGSERYIGTGEIQTLIKSGFESNYISGGFQHFNIDLDIEMKSPIILYPQDILDPYNKKCLFIKCGDFEMKSELPPRQILEKNYEISNDRKELFDTYKMKIENFCMFTYDNFKGNFNNLVNIKGLNLVENITVNFQFEQNFESKNKNFEKTKILLDLGKIKFNLRDTQIMFFIDLLAKMQLCNKKVSIEVEKKTSLYEIEEDKQNKEDLAKEEKEKKEKQKEKKEKEEKILKEREEKLLKEKEEKNKKKEELLNRLTQNEDPNSLLFEFKMESIELSLMKSISSNERNILSKLERNKLENIDIEYRDFIVLSLNNFLINVITTEKGNMSVDISMESTGIKDMETIIKSKDNPKGELLVNEEFQHLIKMNFHEKKEGQNQHLNRYMKKSSKIFKIDIIYEDRKIEENKNEKFMKISYKSNNITKTQEVNIVLEEIRICFSMSSIARLYQFYSYYFNMYSKSGDDVTYLLAEMEEKSKKEIYKKNLIEKRLSKESLLENDTTDLSIQLSKSSDQTNKEQETINKLLEEKKEKKTIFGDKFVQHLAKDLKVLGNGFEEKIINTRKEKVEEEIEEEIEIKEKEETKKIREKNKMKITFQMKKASLYFPLDETKGKTKVLKFNFNFLCTILMNNEYDNIQNIYGRQVGIEYITKNMNLSAKCVNVKFKISLFKNKAYITKDCDYMLQGFRFNSNINSFLLLPHREKSVMAINVFFEPLIFNIGFRHTKTLMGFMPKLTQFLTDMNKEYESPLKELNIIEEAKNEIIIENENNIINDNNDNIIIEENDENLTEEEKKERNIKKKKIIEGYKIRKRQELEAKKLKKQKEIENQNKLKIKTNIDKINNMIDVKVTFEKLSFKYFDDSGAYLIPLLKIESQDILTHFIQNSNPDSVENISNLLLESISRREIPLKDYDINGLYMYVQFDFNISINFFNDRIINWEPIIERYSGILKVDQVTSFSRMRVSFNSDDIFNINISISSMNVLNRVLKKFGESEEKWDKELNKNIDDVSSDTNSRKAIEFVNLSGIEIRCWLDAKKEALLKDNKDDKNIKYQFSLASSEENNKKVISSNELKLYYQQLSEAQLRINKDKFSFQIRGYVPVYSNDFSTNYTSNFRMKKDKIAKDEIRYIYTGMKNKRNQANPKKDPNKDNSDEIIIRSNSLALSDLLREDEQQDLISESNNDNDSESNTADINEGMKEKLIEKDIPKKQINLFEEEVEILVKVRQSGTTKTIIFQSNVFIFNNLQIPIYLSFISPDDYLVKYGGKDSNINHLENKNNIKKLKTCEKYSIPIYYITNKYRVYVSFYNEDNPQENNFVLLYEHFSILKRNLPEFIKYNKENSPEFEGDKRTILEDQYSKILKIEHNKDQFYISCNLLLQKGASDKINEMPNILEEANKYINIDQNNKELRTKNIDLLIDSIKHDFYGKTFSYLFILDESLMIENKIPFNIQCKLNEKNMTIRPLQQKEFLDIDQSKTSLQFYFNYDDKKFISDILNINELDKKNIDKNKEYINETSQIKLYNEEKKDEFIECNISFQDNFNATNLIGAYEKEYEQSLRTFQNKKKIIIFSKCIFVNKTNYLLYLLSEDEKKLEKEPINKYDNYNYKILPNSISIINAKDIKNKFKLKTEDSDWSKKFNINTIGNTGVISLNIPDKKNKDKITMLDVGISIPTSWYFTESLLITIVPRFMFINELGLDIEYNQYNNKINKEKNDKNELFEKKELKNNESVNLNLLKANKNMKKMIRIKFKNSKEFSTPFDLEEMGDIDLKIEIDKKMKNEIEKRNAKIDKEIKKLKKLEKKKMKEMNSEKKKEEELIENIDNDNISDEEEEEIVLIKKDVGEKKIEIKEKEKEKEKEEEEEISPEEYIKKEKQEEKKLLEKYELRPRKYIIFQQNQKDYLLVRISKSTINGLINIVIFPPEYPQYKISNESNHRLAFKQKKDEYSNELFYLERNTSIPYVWGDSLRNEKILIIKSDKNEMEINLNDIKILNKKFEINENGINKSYTFYFQTLIEDNKTRKLIIKNETKENKSNWYFLEVLKGRKKSLNLKFKIVTKGLGISVINNEPKEIFYISAYGSTIEGNKFSYKKDDCEHSIINVMFTLRNFQIDYCLEDNFKSMFIPVKQITPLIDEEINNGKNKEEFIPLIQSIVSFHTITNPLTLISSDEIPQIDLTIQPFKLNFSQFQIISLMSLYQEIKSELDFFLTKPEPFKEYNNIKELNQSLFGGVKNEQKELIYPPQYYDKMLNVSLGTILPKQLIYESENHRMFFVKNIHIGSLEIGVTTRIDLSAFKDMLPSFLLGIISALGNVFLHITDYKLKFTTSLYSDVFADVYSLSDTLYNTYYEQLIRGLFRIVGNLDIIGNPTGYVSSIADGFMQIIEAPRKGLINGPLGFGEGVAKGFGTFITTVLSSTFDVVGKISGTLLASCEVLQGEKVFEQLEEREPEHIFEGLYIGIKEGVIDLGKGLGGIFYKPYMGAKKEGVKGFFKGLGSGFLGAVVSPFTAIFRVTNNIFVGLKNTVNLFNPKLKTERFRYPRTIEKANGLKSYDEDKATIQAILDYLKDYQGEEILYFKQFEYLEPIYENSKSYLILTNKCIIVVYQAEEVVFKVMVNYIESIEVHKEQNGNNYDIVFNLKDNSRKYIRTKDANLCTDFYLMFEGSKE